MDATTFSFFQRTKETAVEFEKVLDALINRHGDQIQWVGIDENRKFERTVSSESDAWIKRDQMFRDSDEQVLAILSVLEDHVPQGKAAAFFDPNTAAVQKAKYLSMLRDASNELGILHSGITGLRCRYEAIGDVTETM